MNEAMDGCMNNDDDVDGKSCGGHDDDERW